MTREEKIEHILRSFGVIVKVAHIIQGYSSNTYLLEVSAGVKINSIHSRRLDIANALDVASVRLSTDLVVYEGKSYLAVECTKKREETLLYDPKELNGLKLPLGKDNFRNTIYWDLNNHSTPHMLVCGATGSGKSVFLQSTLEYGLEAGIDDVVVFDPKYEFRHYDGRGAFVVNEIEEIELYMQKMVFHMNELVKKGKKKFTLVIFDEFADAVTNSRKGKALGDEKSLEENMRILLQKGRSCGFRIIAATQRASVKVITGDAKVNFPVQVCFRVPKEADSRVVLDEAGAETLAGYGDGLIKSPAFNETIRFQAFYKSHEVVAND